MSSRVEAGCQLRLVRLALRQRLERAGVQLVARLRGRCGRRPALGVRCEARGRGRHLRVEVGVGREGGGGGALKHRRVGATRVRAARRAGGGRIRRPVKLEVRLALLGAVQLAVYKRE